MAARFASEMGWIIALLVFIVALLTAIGVLSGAHLLYWMIAGLALAILLGGAAPFPWPWAKS